MDRTGTTTAPVRSADRALAGLEHLATAKERLSLHGLHQELGIHLARLDGREVVSLATRRSLHQLRRYSRVGRRLPAHTTSLGTALLAARTDEELEGLVVPPRVAELQDRRRGVGLQRV